MDQFYLAALALPVLISVVGVVLGLIVLWAVIRSAVFSALQKHERVSAVMPRRGEYVPAVAPVRPERGPRDG
jgi:hypothetical protein